VPDQVLVQSDVALLRERSGGVQHPRTLLRRELHQHVELRHHVPPSLDAGLVQLLQRRVGVLAMVLPAQHGSAAHHRRRVLVVVRLDVLVVVRLDGPLGLFEVRRCRLDGGVERLLGLDLRGLRCGGELGRCLFGGLEGSRDRVLADVRDVAVRSLGVRFFPLLDVLPRLPQRLLHRSTDAVVLLRLLGRSGHLEAHLRDVHLALAMQRLHPASAVRLQLLQRPRGIRAGRINARLQLLHLLAMSPVQLRHPVLVRLDSLRQLLRRIGPQLLHLRPLALHRLRVRGIQPQHVRLVRCLQPAHPSLLFA